MFIIGLSQKEASPKGYGTEEVIEFCVEFIPESRHEERLCGKGTIGRKPLICRDGHSYTQAHYTVLQNSILAIRYINEHKNFLRSNKPGKPDSWIREKHMENFGGWLQTHLDHDDTVGSK